MQYLARTVPSPVRFATNGGFTILVLFRFENSSPKQLEPLLSLNNGPTDWMIMSRTRELYSVEFGIAVGNGMAFGITAFNIIPTSTTSAWVLVAMRATVPGPVIMRVNGAQNSTNTIGALADVTYSNTWIGRSPYTFDGNFANVDVAYAGVWGTALWPHSFLFLPSLIAYGLWGQTAWNHIGVANLFWAFLGLAAHG